MFDNPFEDDLSSFFNVVHLSINLMLNLMKNARSILNLG